jgi:hypothetical protein
MKEESQNQKHRWSKRMKIAILLLTIIACFSCVLAASVILGFYKLDQAVEANISTIQNIKIYSDHNSGTVPFTVNFSCECINYMNITSYLWDFGDGNYSSTKNPIHMFENEGKYSVILTISYIDLFSGEYATNDTNTYFSEPYVVRAYAARANTNDIQETSSKSYFTLTGKIYSDYDETIDVDYIILSNGDWYDLGGTIYSVKQNGKNSFSSFVKTGYSSYTLIVGWFYPLTDIQVDRVDHIFTNPSAEDMTFDIRISSSGTIIVTKT